MDKTIHEKISSGDVILEKISNGKIRETVKRYDRHTGLYIGSESIDRTVDDINAEIEKYQKALDDNNKLIDSRIDQLKDDKKRQAMIDELEKTKSDSIALYNRYIDDAKYLLKY